MFIKSVIVKLFLQTAHVRDLIQLEKLNIQKQQQPLLKEHKLLSSEIPAIYGFINCLSVSPNTLESPALNLKFYKLQ